MADPTPEQAAVLEVLNRYHRFAAQVLMLDPIDLEHPVAVVVRRMAQRVKLRLVDGVDLADYETWHAIQRAIDRAYTTTTVPTEHPIEAAAREERMRVLTGGVRA